MIQRAVNRNVFFTLLLLEPCSLNSRKQLTRERELGKLHILLFIAIMRKGNVEK